MSAGAVALCKHFERGGYSSDPTKGRDLHPFWKMPVGSNEKKNVIAEEILTEMLQGAAWKNVIWLHEGVAVYEIRVTNGYGMRWTLDIRDGRETENECSKHGDAEKPWSIVKTTFRASSNLSKGSTMN